MSQIVLGSLLQQALSEAQKSKTSNLERLEHQLRTRIGDPEDYIKTRWYTTWDADVKFWAIEKFFTAHPDDKDPKVLFNKISDAQQMGPSVRISNYVKNRATPYMQLHNLFDTGDKMLIPASSHTLDNTYTISIPFMGYVIEYWYPYIDKSHFLSSLVQTYEEGVRDKKEYTVCDLLTPKIELTPNCKELPKFNPADWYKILYYGGIFIIIITSVGAATAVVHELRT